MFCTVNCKIYISLARSALRLAKSLVADFSANIVISCENRKAFNIKMSSRHVLLAFCGNPNRHAGFPMRACRLSPCMLVMDMPAVRCWQYCKYGEFGEQTRRDWLANTASLLCNYGVFASRFAAGMARGDLWRAVEKQQRPVPASCGGARNTGVMRIAAPRPCHCSTAPAALFYFTIFFPPTMYSPLPRASMSVPRYRPSML